MKKGDAFVEAVERAYWLDGTEADWIGSFLDAIAPELDVGLGVHAWTYDVATGAQRVLTTVFRNGAPGFAESMLDAVMRSDSAPFVRAVLASPVNTLSELGLREAALSGDAMKAHCAKYGAVDLIRGSITDPAGFGVAFAAPLPAVRTYEASFTARLAQVAAHLHTALRARRRLAEREATEAAVLTPAGRVEHAADDAKSSFDREALRDAALTLDRARGALRRNDPDLALDAWQSLVDGRFTLVDRVESDGRRFLIARRNAPRPPAVPGLVPVETACAIYAAMGHSQKLIGYELGLARSTVSEHVQSAMRKLGVATKEELARVFGPPVRER